MFASERPFDALALAWSFAIFWGKLTRIARTISECEKRISHLIVKVCREFRSVAHNGVRCVFLRGFSRKDTPFLCSKMQCECECGCECECAGVQEAGTEGLEVVPRMNRVNQRALEVVESLANRCRAFLNVCRIPKPVPCAFTTTCNSSCRN